MKIKELFESQSLGKIQKFVITMWGRYMFMHYNDYPRSGGLSEKDLMAQIDEYDQILKDQSHRDAAVFAEDLASDKSKFSKNLVDNILKSCESTLEKDTDFFRAGTLHNDGWSSFSSVYNPKPFFYDEVGTIKKIALPKGAKVIYTRGLADTNEVIIHNQELKKAKIEELDSVDMDDY